MRHCAKQIDPSLMHSRWLPDSSQWHSDDDALQFTQLPPPAPHCVSSVPLWHTPPEQHPFGHDEKVQMQLPAKQVEPSPHSKSVPHRQSPVGPQLSDRSSHCVQKPPFTPHVASVAGLHVLPWQHPAQPLVGVHTQVPLLHASPAPHAAPEPQRQVPDAEHESAPAPHAVHAPPPVPHCALSCT